MTQNFRLLFTYSLLLVDFTLSNPPKHSIYVTDPQKCMGYNLKFKTVFSVNSGLQSADLYTAGVSISYLGFPSREIKKG